jgi:hypothetical protein
MYYTKLTGWKQNDKFESLSVKDGWAWDDLNPESVTLQWMQGVRA